MSRYLILMRHAQAQQELYGLNDRDRAMTIAGMQELDQIKVQLPKFVHSLEYVLCSNVKRTRQTLEGIRSVLPQTVKVHFDDGLYQASGEKLRHKIETLSSKIMSILILAHNPGLKVLFHQLCDTAYYNFPTGGFVVCEVKCDNWHEISPKNINISYPDRRLLSLKA